MVLDNVLVLSAGAGRRGAGHCEINDFCYFLYVFDDFWAGTLVAYPGRAQVVAAKINEIYKEITHISRSDAVRLGWRSWTLLLQHLRNTVFYCMFLRFLDGYVN